MIHVKDALHGDICFSCNGSATVIYSFQPPDTLATGISVQLCAHCEHDLNRSDEANPYRESGKPGPSVSGWQLVTPIGTDEDSEIRRFKVTGGWLYQVSVNGEDWFPPMFVHA